MTSEIEILKKRLDEIREFNSILDALENEVPAEYREKIWELQDNLWKCKRQLKENALGVLSKKISMDKATADELELANKLIKKINPETLKTLEKTNLQELLKQRKGIKGNMVSLTSEARSIAALSRLHARTKKSGYK